MQRNKENIQQKLKTKSLHSFDKYLFIISGSVVELHHESDGVQYDEEEDNVFELLWRNEPPRLVLDAVFWNVPFIEKNIYQDVRHVIVPYKISACPIAQNGSNWLSATYLRSWIQLTCGVPY